MDFMRHVFSYFSDSGTSRKRKKRKEASSSSVSSPERSISLRSKKKKKKTHSHSMNLEGYAPLYTKDGRVMGYVQSDDGAHSSRKSVLTAPVPASKGASTKDSDSDATTIDSTASDSTASESSGEIDPKTSKRSERNLKNSSREWDLWPNGTFTRNFTYEQYEDAGELKVHWATRSWGGNKKGKPDAPRWQDGRLMRRKCQGIIQCTDPECGALVRPQSTDARVKEQLQKTCTVCDGDLMHITCGAHDSKWLWKGGVRYQHEGEHVHLRPSHLLHATGDEMKRFQDVVLQNPSTKALGLIIGAPSVVPGITAPRESVRTISPLWGNKGRVTKDRRKILRAYSTKGESDFLDGFSAFLQRNKGWMIHSHLQDGIMVFSFQSQFMREQLVGTKSANRPINGIVSDAAHGWWKNRGHLLMVSSTYSVILRCWAPGVMSFTNGATAEHFRHHFLALFISIASEAQKRDIPLHDKLFANVIDFSEAERNGFVLAFVDFWKKHARRSTLKKRTRPQLKRAANRLLRGCRQHFRANARRIAKMSGVVHPDDVEAFLNRVFALMEVRGIQEFEERCTDILKRWPDVEPWLNWYRRPDHARMLFESAREMDIGIWESIPDTTNAEEAMHWKLYAGCGRDHGFLKGMEWLRKVAEYYEDQYNDQKVGRKLQYGPGERSVRIGTYNKTTKPRRFTKRYSKSDSRGPDTVKTLTKANLRMKQIIEEEQQQGITPENMQ